MIALMMDTSVLVKWFTDRDEQEVEQAHALRAAHVAQSLTVGIIDLAFYELGNSLIRRHHWAAPDVSTVLEHLLVLLGRQIQMEPIILNRAADLAEAHRLSFYDACWAAAAQHLGVPLVSADRQLLDAGLAESATDAATRLGLRR